MVDISFYFTIMKVMNVASNQIDSALGTSVIEWLCLCTEWTKPCLTVLIGLINIKSIRYLVD